MSLDEDIKAKYDLRTKEGKSLANSVINDRLPLCEVAPLKPLRS
jgi:hypothetical protein